MKRVTLTLAYDMGLYNEEDLVDMRKDPKDWGEVLYQGDINTDYMKIIGVWWEDT